MIVDIHTWQGKICVHKNLYTRVHSRIIYKSKNNSNIHQLMSGQTTWYNHTMKYYCHTKKVLTHATIWINPENIMLTESQTQMPHITWFPLHEMTTVGQSIETGSRLVFARGWEERGMGSDCWQIHGFFFSRVLQNILELDLRFYADIIVNTL